MLLIDGVRYNLWTPQSEDEFERVVVEHAQEIFGEKSIYLDRKQKLKSLAGIGSIPDGYAITFGNPPQWHIVEMELSSHPLHEHIVTQIGKFINGIKNPRTRNEIVAAIYAEVHGDEFLTLKIKEMCGTAEIYKFLSDLVSQPPTLTIIIEKATEELYEAVNVLNHPQIKVVEFQTFTREGAEAVHAHLFEPLHKAVPTPQIPSPIKADVQRPSEYPHAGKSLLLVVRPTNIKRGYISIPSPIFSQDDIFPNATTTLDLETDKGVFTIQLNKQPHKNRRYLRGSRGGGGIMQKWFEAHPELKKGDKVRITAIEPMKRYRLEIVK